MKYKKETGSYYTPQRLASFVSEIAIKQFHSGTSLSVLEPSVGDGAFLRALNHHSEASEKIRSITSIDVDQIAIKKARYLKRKVNFKFKTKFLNRDFLDFQSKVEAGFDLIIGNPPYITRRNLSLEMREKSNFILKSQIETKRNASNILEAFILHSLSMLNEQGVLCFILPKEFLNVNYGQSILNHLTENNYGILLYDFSDKLFEGIDQEIICLVASKQFDKFGLQFFEVNQKFEAKLIRRETTEELEKRDRANIKWSFFSSNSDDLNFLEALYAECKNLSNYCSSSAGIVTAANDYFILDAETVKDFNLSPYCKPIIQKGAFVNGKAYISHIEHQKLIDEEKPCYLIDLNTVEDISCPDLQAFLEIGEAQDIHNRYKCKLRRKWYQVPSIWASEGVFFKRTHEYPKLIDNQDHIFVTDSGYRIIMNEEFNIESLVYSFYNSFTLAYAELAGRHYGGGVLELTPNEFKKLPLPYKKTSAKTYLNFQETFTDKKDIQSFLNDHDNAILKDVLGMGKNEILRIQKIRKDLMNKRIM